VNRILFIIGLVLLGTVLAQAKGVRDSWLWSETQFAQAVTGRVDKTILILNGKMVKRARVVQGVMARDVPKYRVWILKPFQQIRPQAKYLLRADPYALLPRPSGAKAMSRSESSDAVALPPKPTVRTIVWDWADGVQWDIIGTKDLVNWITVATNLTTNYWRFTNAAPVQFYRVGASWR
jgi:hypothetical protein